MTRPSSKEVLTWDSWKHVARHKPEASQWKRALTDVRDFTITTFSSRPGPSAGPGGQGWHSEGHHLSVWPAAGHGLDTSRYWSPFLVAPSWEKGLGIPSYLPGVDLSPGHVPSQVGPLEPFVLPFKKKKKKDLQHSQPRRPHHVVLFPVSRLVLESTNCASHSLLVLFVCLFLACISSLAQNCIALTEWKNLGTLSCNYDIRISELWEKIKWRKSKRLLINSNQWAMTAWSQLICFWL